MRNKMTDPEYKQLPKTAEYLEKMEEIYAKIGINPEEYDYLTDEEKHIFNNPMLHLAEVICDETYAQGADESWAHDLAYFIMIITGHKPTFNGGERCKCMLHYTEEDV